MPPSLTGVESVGLAINKVNPERRHARLTNDNWEKECLFDRPLSKSFDLLRKYAGSQLYKPCKTTRCSSHYLPNVTAVDPVVCK